MSTVSFVRVGKVFKDGTRAVEGLNVEVADGEFMVLVGPSGCGKTTALRMCAGLEAVSEGEIRIDGTAVNTLEPRKRDVAMVFQNYALYPSMSVFENIAFPLRSRGVPRADVRARVDAVARTLGIEPLLRRRPGQLSGGQSQRVAMGRALVREPRVFLMDEPLSNLDAKLRMQMRTEIATLQQRVGVTTLYVTHDQVEAMTMGTRIAVMRRGVLQQLGPPQEIYDHPANLFVASFVGSPPMNLVKARIADSKGRLSVTIGAEAFELDADAAARVPALSGYADGEVALGVRPEQVSVGTAQRGARLPAELRLVEALGHESLVHLEVAAEPTVHDEVLEVARDIDASAAASLADVAGRRRAPVVARTALTGLPGPGARVDVTIPHQAMYFFDLSTGAAITTEPKRDSAQLLAASATGR